MEIKKLIILISVILSFLKSKFEKTNKKYLNNIKKSIGKKKIFLIHLSSIGSSIYTSCYLKRLIIEIKSGLIKKVQIPICVLYTFVVLWIGIKIYKMGFIS